MRLEVVKKEGVLGLLSTFLLTQNSLIRMSLCLISLHWIFPFWVPGSEEPEVPELPPLELPVLGGGLEGSEEPAVQDIPGGVGDPSPQDGIDFVPEFAPLQVPFSGGGLEESEEPSVPDFPASLTSDPDLSDPTSLVPDLPPLQLPSFGGGGLEESEEPGVSDIPEVVESPALPSFFSGFGPEISDTEEVELDLPELDFAPDSVLDFAESIDTVPGFPGE
ncbi:LOW QUALITY PROTEIN: hypothetical protein BSKO_12223 [Bryopsis sp. KO-2023]|nr:LOW QUALITY PROTEIN: hypothetical protein BSKO_12223 [Bryopsis sp. KO-2023]